MKKKYTCEKVPDWFVISTAKYTHCLIGKNNETDKIEVLRKSSSSKNAILNAIKSFPKHNDFEVADLKEEKIQQVRKKRVSKKNK